MYQHNDFRQINMKVVVKDNTGNFVCEGDDF